MESQGNDEEDVVQQRDLPFDLITQNILTRLPVESIVRFKSVSKLWYSTLSSSPFAFAHLKFPNPSITESLIIRSNDNFQIMSYENGEIDLVNIEVDFDVGDEKMVMVGSCNGLVCLGSESGRLFILWNPITREFRKYFDSEISNLFTAHYSVNWGFGYLSAVDDYKVVRVCNEPSPTSYKVHVYSFRSDKWRIIDNNVAPHDQHDSDFRNPIRLRRSAVLVNETLYWMGFSGLLRKILSFDLASEIFDRFPHLEVSTLLSYVTNQDECFDKLLFVVNGCLSTYDKLITAGDIITVMKTPGVIEEIILPMDPTKMMYFEKFIGFSKSDKVFVEWLKNHSLGVIDLTSQPLKVIQLMRFEAKHKIELVSYCASLISPNAHVIRTLEGENDHSNI